MSLFPSSTISIISPLSFPPPNTILAPTLHFLPGFTSTSHVSCLSSSLLRRSTSMAAPVSSFSPIRRAGITLVSLITRQSPALRYSVISLNILCSIAPVFLSSTISLELERSESGSCAISSSGRS